MVDAIKNITGVNFFDVKTFEEAKAIAKEKGAKVFGIVGRDGGYTKKVGDNVVVVPVVDEKLVTPHSEAFQAVVWHCLVSNPILQIQATKW